MQNSLVAVFGMKGHGKTTYMIRETEAARRLIVIDPLHQFRSGLIFRQASDLLAYFRDRNPETFRCICRFEDAADGWTETEAALEFAYELGNVTVAIDEVDKICSASAISPALSRIINYGRHKDIDLVTCARRPARVNRDLTSNADSIVSFKVQEPNDLKYLQEFGFSDSVLKGLAKYEYVSNQ